MTIENTGRYYIIDHTTGRKFCVEPISERNQKIDDRAFTNGGTDGSAVKNKSAISGGSIYRDESILTEENGFKNIHELPAGTSPEGFIERLIKGENMSHESTAL